LLHLEDIAMILADRRYCIDCGQPYGSTGAYHTDLCVDEARLDLQTSLVFAQAAPEARGYQAKLWRRYVSTARAWLRGVHLPPPITFLVDNNLNRDFLSKATSTGIPGVERRLTDWISLLNRDLGRRRGGV
jgi:hypothetical protein